MSSRRWFVAAALAVAGCDTGDGRALDPPPPGATAPPIATSTTATTAVLGTTGEAATMTLASPAFVEGGPIPARQSCDGEELSPPLTWSGVPAGTVELAVTVVDPDAPGAPFVHWIVVGIDPVVTGFGEGGLPESAIEMRPWIGPCPPAGETHDYVVTLYALTEALGLGSDAGQDAALAALESTPGPTVVLTGTFAR
jgi:Raf kinase inhibitor-like YbhB/YbcL family protein